MALLDAELTHDWRFSLILRSRKPMIKTPIHRLMKRKQLSLTRPTVVLKPVKRGGNELPVSINGHQFEAFSRPEVMKMSLYDAVYFLRKNNKMITEAVRDNALKECGYEIRE